MRIALYEVDEGRVPPLDIVLGLFFDEMDALQDIGNIVDPSLLNFQLRGSNVQVQDTIWGFLHEKNKLFGQKTQGIVIATGQGGWGTRGGRLLLRTRRMKTGSTWGLHPNRSVACRATGGGRIEGRTGTRHRW